MVIATRQKLQMKPLKLGLTLDGNCIEQVKEHRLLGVVVDERMQWKSHIENVCKTVSKGLFMLGRLKPFIDADTRKMFFNAHIQSHINYASTVWDECSDVHLQRLKSLNRRAAKLIVSDDNLSTEQKMEVAGILPLKKHFLYNKGVFMHKIWYKKTPQYMEHFFKRSESSYGTYNRLYIVPLTNKDIYKQSLSFSGSSSWNKLPVSLKDTSSLSGFKTKLFKYLVNTEIPL